RKLIWAITIRSCDVICILCLTESLQGNIRCRPQCSRRIAIVTAVRYCPTNACQKQKQSMEANQYLQQNSHILQIYNIYRVALALILLLSFLATDTTNL